MKRVMAWMATDAALDFALPTSGGQNDCRLPPLFYALKNAASAEEAEPVETRIWSLWTQSGDQHIDRLMVTGLAEMAAQRFEQALAAFNSIIRQKPDFAEAWNKRATLFYLLGDYQRSTEDVERVLALEPRHFGALSGLGLIALAVGEERRALEAFEAALLIHPHMAGADTHIRTLREKIKGRGI